MLTDSCYIRAVIRIVSRAKVINTALAQHNTGEVGTVSVYDTLSGPRMDRRALHGDKNDENGWIDTLSYRICGEFANVRHTAIDVPRSEQPGL